MPALELRNISKSFDGKTAVAGVSFTVEEGEFLTLLGPSGCGKSTILRIVGGFLRPDSGEIILHGENVAGVPANRREVSTVFQGYALFPHLTVRGNVGFSLRMKGTPKREIEKRVDEILEMTDLDLYGNRKPAELSGGQQQRVAIARCLISKPRLMLFDEPLGALDLKLRRQMQTELKKIQRSLGLTYVYVTHDQEEALSMSDRIAVMNDGIIEQMGSPEALYSRPATKFSALFLGETNLFTGIYREKNGGAFFETEGILIPLPENSLGSCRTAEARRENNPSCLFIRPEFISLSREKGKGPLSGVVEKILFLGQSFRYDIKLASGKEVQVLSEGNSFHPGEEVFLSYDNDKISLV
jgi:spermidine/putrescine transport system ATP-binding protein